MLIVLRVTPIPCKWRELAGRTQKQYIRVTERGRPRGYATMLRKTLIVLAVAIMPQGMTNGYIQSYSGWGYGGL